MKKLRDHIRYFRRGEIILWGGSMAVIFLSFLIFDRKNYLTLAASLVGVTSLIYNAKGNPFGQLLMVIFSLMYGVISWNCRYYGEMITYLGMTMPMAVFALVSWLRNPYGQGRAEVRVNRIGKTEAVFACALAAVVTFLFYRILAFFNTANPGLSAVSVTTSFLAVYLTFRRSAFFAAAYAANDIVLIALWGLAARTDISCLSVAACFAAFLANDVYGYISWQRMEKRQARGE